MTVHARSGAAGAEDLSLAVLSIRRKATGLVEHYHSMPYVPPWRPRTWAKVRAAFLRQMAHVIDTYGSGAHWIEVPDHPIPSRRERRRYA